MLHLHSFNACINENISFVNDEKYLLRQITLIQLTSCVLINPVVLTFCCNNTAVLPKYNNVAKNRLHSFD